eukprot:TRINITY_DN5534_c0_g1_i1.p1 TRINITY_DN5534_c0_g1~~TRINITY_DN5534_c0_g1_i1.p1  ORF type:complete len:317 (+),score=58.22 TRINITY_DN5534_c0_g1_i1:148-1098(+)
MLTALLTASLAPATAERPVIGIWAHPYASASPDCGGTCEYIAASYVKWVESAGGRAVPIPYNVSTADADVMFKNLNGILFPGGSPPPTPGAFRMVQSAVAAYQSGDHVPVWGTCLGFQWLAQIVANDMHILDTGFDSENISLPLDLTSFAQQSRILDGSSQYGDELRTILSNKSNPVTMNNHQNGVTPDTYKKTASLNTFFNVISTNVDRKNREFISMWEGKTAPIYGSQWHPEKNNFEWGVSKSDPSLPLEAINHSPEAVKASQAMADFFIAEAKRNSHAFPTPADEYNALVWHYPVLTEQFSGFSQKYLFKNFQ